MAKYQPKLNSKKKQKVIKRRGNKDLLLFASKMPNAPAHILNPVAPVTRAPCRCHLSLTAISSFSLQLLTESKVSPPSPPQIL